MAAATNPRRVPPVRLAAASTGVADGEDDVELGIEGVVHRVVSCEVPPAALFAGLLAQFQSSEGGGATSAEAARAAVSAGIPHVPNALHFCAAFVRGLRAQTEPVLAAGARGGRRARALSVASASGHAGSTASPQRSPLFPSQDAGEGEAGAAPPPPTAGAETTVGFGPGPVVSIGFGAQHGAATAATVHQLTGRKGQRKGKNAQRAGGDAGDAGSGAVGGRGQHSGGRNGGGGAGGGARRSRPRGRAGDGMLDLGGLLEARLSRPSKQGGGGGGGRKKRHGKRRIRATPVDAHDVGTGMVSAAFASAPLRKAGNRGDDAGDDWGAAHVSRHRGVAASPPAPAPAARSSPPTLVPTPPPDTDASGSGAAVPKTVVKLSPATAAAMPPAAPPRPVAKGGTDLAGGSVGGESSTTQIGWGAGGGATSSVGLVPFTARPPVSPTKVPSSKRLTPGGSEPRTPRTPVPRGTVASRPLRGVVASAAGVRRAAAAYAALVVARVVPSVSSELQFVAELLCLDPRGELRGGIAAGRHGDSDLPPVLGALAGVQEHEGGAGGGGGAGEGATAAPPGLASALARLDGGTGAVVPWDADKPACTCLLLACESLAFMLPFLSLLGVPTLKLIAAHATITDALPSLAEEAWQLVQVLEEQGASESAAAGEEGSVMGVHADFSLPFRPETDSRHHFRTRTLSTLFQNREHTRDAFLQLHRHWVEVANNINPAALKEYKAAMPEKARAFLHTVKPENRGWFAQFFLEQLVARCAGARSTEHDHHVRRLAKSDRKLQLLHKRMSDRSIVKPYDRPAMQPSRAPTPRSDRESVTSVDPSGGPGFGASNFPGAQDFFRLFLEACDSYSLNTRVVALIAACLAELSVPHSPAELSRRLASRVTRLRLLGKFLGFLIFSPQWSSTSEVYSAGSVALQADMRDAVASANRVRPAVDLRAALRRAASQHCLVLVVPWLAEVVAMMRLDAVSTRTEYYSGLLQDLRNLRWSAALQPSTSVPTASDATGARAATALQPATPTAAAQRRRFTPARLAVLLQLDALFEALGVAAWGDAHGADPEEAAWTLEAPSDCVGLCLDEYPGAVGPGFVQECAPRLAAVHKLLARGGRLAGALHSASPARKIRPMSLHSSFASAAAFSAALANDASSQEAAQQGGAGGLGPSSLNLTQAIAGTAPAGAGFGPASSFGAGAPTNGTVAGGSGSSTSGDPSGSSATRGGVSGSAVAGKSSGGGGGNAAAAAQSSSSSASLLAAPFRKVLSARLLQEQPHLQRLIDVVVQACTQNAAASALATCVGETVAAARAAAARDTQSGTKGSQARLKQWALTMARASAQAFATHHAATAAGAALAVLLPPDMDASVRDATIAVARELAADRSGHVASTRVAAAVRRQLPDAAGEEAGPVTAPDVPDGAVTVGSDNAGRRDVSAHTAQPTNAQLPQARCAMHAATPGPDDARVLCLACTLVAGGPGTRAAANVN